MIETATRPASTTARESATETSASENTALLGWERDLVSPWRLRSWIGIGGNDERPDEELWVEMARRARRSWIRENPY